MAIMSLSVWVPTDVDFVARFPSNCRFFRGNRRVSRIVLSGNTTGELMQAPQRRRLQKRRK